MYKKEKIKMYKIGHNCYSSIRRDSNLDASNLFFQLIAKRYKKHCTIITTNSNFSKWPDIFVSPTIANAILDILLHHSHIISIKGPSYRIQSKIQYLDNNSMKDSEVS